MSKRTIEGKAPEDSDVITTHIVLPSHTNALGTIFGGTVASWIDIAAAICAGKHARRTVVTASIDALHFVAPIRLGQVVHIKARVNYASRTSMEVGVRVDSEDPVTGDLHHNCTAYTTFVALDSNRRPVPVPAVHPKTPEDVRRFEQAKKRREARIRLAEEFKSAAHGGK